MKRAFQLFRSVDCILYFYAIMLLFPIFFLSALRWHYLLGLQKINYPFVSALLVNQSSNFIAFVSPGRIGELIKVFYLKKDLNIPVSRSIPSVVVPRIMDVFVLLVCCFWGLSSYSTNARIVIILAAFSCVGFLLYFFKLKIPKNWTGGNKGQRFWKSLFYFIRTSYLECRSIISIKLSIVLVITIAIYLILFYLSYMLSKAMGLDINISTVVSIVSVGNILSYLPISISGIGTRDAGYIFLFSQIGRTQEEAIVFSNLILISFYLLGGILGLICYTIKPISLSKLDENINML